MPAIAEAAESLDKLCHARITGRATSQINIELTWYFEHQVFSWSNLQHCWVLIKALVFRVQKLTAVCVTFKSHPSSSQWQDSSALCICTQHTKNKPSLVASARLLTVASARLLTAVTHPVPREVHQPLMPGLLRTILSMNASLPAVVHLCLPCTCQHSFRRWQLRLCCARKETCCSFVFIEAEDNVWASLICTR
jgi:hypothetical protein